MHNEFTAIIERDEDWFIAYCPEIPGANGQGRTQEEARANLGEAIALILEDRREQTGHIEAVPRHQGSFNVETIGGLHDALWNAGVHAGWTGVVSTPCGGGTPPDQPPGRRRSTDSTNQD